MASLERHRGASDQLLIGLAKSVVVLVLLERSAELQEFSAEISELATSFAVKRVSVDRGPVDLVGA